MQEISFWRRNRRSVIVGLLVVLLSVIGGSVIMVREQTQIPLGQVCGSISLPMMRSYGGSAVTYYAVGYQGGTARQVEQCFIQAYRQCQNASMLVTWMETDIGLQETLTVEPQNGQCQFISSSQRYSVSQPSGGWMRLPSWMRSPQTTISTCQGLTLTTESLIVKRCGNVDKTIPRTESCSMAYSGNQAGSNKQAEDCFVQDKVRCYPADLFSGSTPPNKFEIDSTCKIIRIANISAV